MKRISDWGLIFGALVAGMSMIIAGTFGALAAGMHDWGFAGVAFGCAGLLGVIFVLCLDGLLVRSGIG